MVTAISSRNYSEDRRRKTPAGVEFTKRLSDMSMNIDQCQMLGGTHMRFSKQKRIHSAVTLCLAALLVVCLIQPAAAQRREQLPVSAIVIRGNVLIDTAVIQRAITKTRVGFPAVAANIRDDVEAIGSLGYFSQVGEGYEIAPDGTTIVVFTVEEFPVVSEIVFKGAQGLPINEFIKQMKVKPGEVFNINLFAKDVASFYEWSEDVHGKPHTVVVENTGISETGVVTIEVSPWKVGEISIKGNEKTKDHVIRRELSFGPGDAIDYEQLIKDMQKVYRLQYFATFPEIMFEPTDRDDVYNVVIEVAELKTGSADFGAGYSSQNGIFGYVDISDINLFGNGQYGSLFFEIGKGSRSYKLSFSEPYLTPDGTSFGIDLYNTHDRIDEKIDETTTLSGTEHVLGGNVTLGRPLGDYTRGSLSLRAERHNISGEIDQVRDPFELVTLGLSVRTDTSNDVRKPTQGYISNLRLETGLTFNGGTASYTKMNAEHRQYFEILDDKLVLAVRGYGGRVLTGTLPDSEQFKIGGSETLRGYAYGEEGLVGDKALLLNTELRFPIWDMLSGVVFFDAGKAWESGQSMNLLDLLKSNGFGVGVRIDTPVGLLRLDYGWGLNEEQKREGHFYFGLGHTF